MDIKSVYEILLNSINITKKSNAKSIIWDLLHIWSMLTNDYKNLEHIKGLGMLEEDCNKIIENDFSSDYDLEFMTRCIYNNYFGECTGYIVSVYLSRLVR